MNIYGDIRLDHAAVIAARRSVIRIFRNEWKTFGKYHLQMQVEQWALHFVKFHFSKAPDCSKRWYRSEVFHDWAKKQYELRNAELLLQLGYGLHFSGRMSREEYQEFKTIYTQKHSEALGKIYPPNPIILQISNQINNQ